MANKLIAIAGGIGSGKSVVSSLLRILGYYVYDCDSEAKKLMNGSTIIKKELQETFGERCITVNNTVDSVYLSSIVFNDKNALNQLNSIIHPKVKEDIIQQKVFHKIFFIETAILMQSNLLDIIDEVWFVSAPIEVRIDRVMKRNGISADDVLKRINAQNNQDYSILNNCKTIDNNGSISILSQVNELLKDLIY